MINISGYKIVEKINEGRTSAIYRAIDNNNINCILKVMNSVNVSSQDIERLNLEYKW